MAYPFAKAPTVKEFADKAKENGCVCEHIDGITGPRGAVVISYLKHDIGGKTLISEPLPSDPEERVSPDTMRRLCDQIALNPEIFGLNLG